MSILKFQGGNPGQKLKSKLSESAGDSCAATMAHYMIAVLGDPDFASDLSVGNSSVNLYGIVTLYSEQFRNVPELYIDMGSWMDQIYGGMEVPGTNGRVRLSRCAQYILMWVPGNSSTWFDDSQIMIKRVIETTGTDPGKCRTFHVNVRFPSF